MPPTPVNATRFRDRELAFSNGAAGRTIVIESANPINFYQAISEPNAMTKAQIDGKLFLPPSIKNRRVPAVIIVPGSLGVAVSHLAHAEALTNLGVAAFVVDPFAARGVTSTVADQTQFSFAASGYDVLASLKTLAALPEIDSNRVGAQGHSRGGAAALTAAMRRFADPVMGAGPRLKAVYAVYPWSGQQFADPSIGDTRVRAVIGERDDWSSPQQVQGHIHTIRLCGGDASFRLFADATHSFDRETGRDSLPDAAMAPNAPTTYIADSGAMMHPISGAADPALVDRDLIIYAIEAGFGAKGATVGSIGDQAAQFRADMTGFWRESLILSHPESPR